MDFSLDYHPRLIVQQIRTAGLGWLRPDSQIEEQIVESVLVEHYVAILLFMPQIWVLCH